MTFDNYILRQISKDDVLAYFQLIDKNRQRLENVFAGTVAKNKTVEDTSVFIEEATAKAEQNIYFPFVIVDMSTQNLVGYIDIKNIDWTIPKAEAGFFMDKEYEGKGIMSKAFQKIVAHCFDVLKFKKLFLRTQEQNFATRKIAENNGFMVEGILRKDYKTTGGIILDSIYYGLVNEAVQ